MKKKFGAAALDILFSSVVYILFMDKLTIWAVNNEMIRRYFPSTTFPGGAHWAVPLPIHAAAFVVLILPERTAEAPMDFSRSPVCGLLYSDGAADPSRRMDRSNRGAATVICFSGRSEKRNILSYECAILSGTFNGRRVLRCFKEKDEP